ncbi:MAG: class I SAM-dependent methyltransferase [Pseudomonadota bacterium]
MALDQYFNRDEIVAAYEGRPLYSERAISALFCSDRFPGGVLREGDAVADIGCGNGRFLTSLLQSETYRYADISFEKVYAVDPADKMLESLSTHFAGTNNLEARLGKFQELPLDDKSVDAIVCAASLHWGTKTEEEAKETRAEFMRVLRPDGRLILISDNLSQKPGLTRQLHDLQHFYEQSFMNQHGMGERAWSFFPKDGFMLPLYYKYLASLNDIRAEFTSQAFIHAMPDDERKDFDAELEEILGSATIMGDGSVELERGCAIVGGTFKPIAATI